MRSPLARLHIALALARQRSQGVVDSELARIKQAADYLNDIITDILSLPLQNEPPWELDDMLDLRSLLQTLIDNYAEQAAEKQVHIDLHCALS